MNKTFYIILSAVLILAACSGNNDSSSRTTTKPISVPKTSADTLTVGFSQMNHVNPWRVAETNDLKREAAERGIELLITDAESSQDKQISDITWLLAQDVDYIICAPLVYEGYEEAFRICREAEVPLIMLDREVKGIPGTDFLTFVGGDFVKEAVQAAQWLAEATDRSARIIELQGRKGASCVKDRKHGFGMIVDNIEGMEIIHSKFADFERIKGQKVMEEIILSFGHNFNAVYAHNDEMAIGAIQALKAANIQPGKDVIVVSIDGSKDALKSIIAGELGATVECTPRLAEKVFQAISDHEQGKPVPEKIIVEERLFEKTNALEHIDEAF